VSAETGICSECLTERKLTLKGLVYKHGDCEGSGRVPFEDMPVLTSNVVPDVSEPAEALLRSTYSVEAVTEFVQSLNKPRKRTWRQRLRDRFDRIADRLDDALDVFDD
jgi:hypothetical protein